jgi:hypothetical protein
MLFSRLFEYVFGVAEFPWCNMSAREALPGEETFLPVKEGEIENSIAKLIKHLR